MAHIGRNGITMNGKHRPSVKIVIKRCGSNEIVDEFSEPTNCIVDIFTFISNTYFSGDLVMVMISTVRLDYQIFRSTVGYV